MGVTNWKALLAAIFLSINLGLLGGMLLTAKVVKHKVLQEVCTYYHDSLDGQSFCYTELNDYLKESTTNERTNP